MSRGKGYGASGMLLVMFFGDTFISSPSKMVQYNPTYLCTFLCAVFSNRSFLPGLHPLTCEGSSLSASAQGGCKRRILAELDLPPLRDRNEFTGVRFGEGEVYIHACGR